MAAGQGYFPNAAKRRGKQASFEYDFTPDMLASLADAVNYAKQKGVRVELVVNPYYPPFADKIGNLADLVAAAEQATGLTVHDYSNSIAGVDGFGDYQHLNKRGAREYLDKLMQDGILGLPGEMGSISGK